jgi:hypothetical protein
MVLPYKIMFKASTCNEGMLLNIFTSGLSLHLSQMSQIIKAAFACWLHSIEYPVTIQPAFRLQACWISYSRLSMALIPIQFSLFLIKF